MNLVDSIPYILSLVSALIISVVSLLQPLKFNILCLRVSITLILFYFLGIFVRKMLTDVINDIKIKTEQKTHLQKGESEQNQHEDDFSPLQVKELGEKEAKIIGNMMKD
ncbi:MAG: hypothetical protein PWR27_22 [Petroclostridium sp.]|uniref:hypothetical protein n=1 Tax=Petroclostridium xylanilyticum TaxID=1792311 RepID=UPI000B998C10|nr:hypothetical protein [Petroclostridium xylanilyticum]MBZ4645887.1 hypothetical protein [Clostridia bacterium]MDK2809313.1 hypothetical protein [Petroclostridium sp.]